MRPSPRSLLLLVTVAAAALVASSSAVAQVEPDEPFTVVEATVADVRAALADGSTTCADVVNESLLRIRAYDDGGPELNAIITTAPDARRQATRLDRTYARSGPVGPLHCIPVVLKDNVDTADMPTTGGSATLSDSVPDADATLTARLRDAGAVILAKGNMDEWAHGGAGGYSSAGGRTFNPYDLGPPGSSSGGPAVAMAASYGILSIGTDTLGSIRGPVTTNGLAGVKPTRGLVSGTGVIPFALTFDVAGPMTRTVTDAAEMLDVIAGYDAADPRTEASIDQLPDSYTAGLTTDALEGARIGVLRTYFNDDVEPAIGVMEDLGATVVDDIEAFDEMRSLSGNYYQLISETEIKTQLGEYLQAYRPDADVQSHADVLAASEDPDFPIAPEILVRLQREATRGSMQDPDYLAAVAFAPATMRAGLDALLAANDLDALLMSSGGSALASFSGYPGVLVPAGVDDDGTPFSLQLMGPAFSEPDLLGYAYAYEQATMNRIPPPYAPELSSAR